MKVSLVTAVRNAEGTVAATVASALAQKGVDLEYIETETPTCEIRADLR